MTPLKLLDRSVGLRCWPMGGGHACGKPSIGRLDVIGRQLRGDRCHSRQLDGGWLRYASVQLLPLRLLGWRGPMSPLKLILCLMSPLKLLACLRSHLQLHIDNHSIPACLMSPLTLLGWQTGWPVASEATTSSAASSGGAGALPPTGWLAGVVSAVDKPAAWPAAGPDGSHCCHHSMSPLKLLACPTSRLKLHICLSPLKLLDCLRCLAG